MNQEITITLPEYVSIEIIDFLIKSMPKKDVFGEQKRIDVLLDFSQVKYIFPEGVLSIICFCFFLRNKSIFPINDVHIHLNSPPENVYTYLTILGFYGQMSIKSEIIEIQNIVHYESELKKERKARCEYNKPLFAVKPNPIILPIETIPMQIDSISGRDFENMLGVFVNHTIDTFGELFQSTHYNFSGEDQHDFLLSNVELYKNVFEHSQSWGIGTIHARPNHGTTVCYFDTGVGFRGSVNKFSTDLQAIEWSLVDGNSSKAGDDNDGFGLTIVQDFVLKRNGNLKIRSGNCLLEITSKSRKNKLVSEFPGVQISYFIPV